jgi:hypothetical protein
MRRSERPLANPERREETDGWVADWEIGRGDRI